MNKVIIVGGVAGGASAAARLRRLDESAEIIVFERGSTFHSLTVVCHIILAVRLKKRRI